VRELTHLDAEGALEARREEAAEGRHDGREEGHDDGVPHHLGCAKVKEGGDDPAQGAQLHVDDSEHQQQRSA
jgi:hypothetical protein